MPDDTLPENEALQALRQACEERDSDREYRAFRGKMARGQTMLELIPTTKDALHNQEVTFDRCLPFADIRVLDPHKASREIIIEYSAMTARITGRNLRIIARGIIAGLVGTVEAYDPDLPNAPPRPPKDDPKPFVDSIRFFRPNRPYEDVLRKIRALEERIEALERKAAH